MAGYMGSAFGGLSVLTSIRYSIDKLRKLNNISYIFNPSWDASGRTRVGANTLPMSLLFITSMKEIGQSEVSDEQLILYRGEETSQLNNENTAPQSVLNVVSDNIINKPRQWQIEAILPAKFDSLINNPFGMTGTFMEDVVFRQLENSDTDVATALGVVPNLLVSSIGDIVSIMSALIPLFDANKWSPLADTKVFAGDILTTTLNGSSYNKDSLVDMWMSRAILKFKPPMEWNYKTVVIHDFDISKRPTEDDCFRLAMTLQEVPIMTTGFYTGILAGLKDTSRLRTTSTSAKWVGDKLKYALNKAGNEPGV